MVKANYTEDNIKSLDWKEHIRVRPGMYIGKLGDGTSTDDGIYVLFKEIMDNSIDEFVMGEGKQIDITLEYNEIKIRDYGRGIPLGKVVVCVSQINTGGKYDSKAFKKTVGLNGVGTKAVNALSTKFKVVSIREGEKKSVVFNKGEIIEELDIEPTKEKNGTEITFVPDKDIFENYNFNNIFLERMIRNYSYLNPGLKLVYNGEVYESKNGLLDLLKENIETDILYPIIQIKTTDLEIAFTHSRTQYGEEYYSFVNGQHTTQGGTHQSYFREAVAKTIKEFFKKNFDLSDVRKSIIGAISIKVVNPIFESQTKTKLGSTDMGDDMPTIRTYINNFVGKELNNYLHKNPKVAEILLLKIQDSEKERKELSGIRKIARERAKKVSLHNKKLRDCRVHYNEVKKSIEKKEASSIFITEGDSASGSITKARDVNTQAVFSLKGKPLNSYGLTKKIVYENEEFNLLQAALNIEDGIENLRYNKIIIATDADVDGMHIRLLLLTFFLQFFPEVIREKHLYILETPLFRVRNKKETIYCYSEKEKEIAINKLGVNPEITRFKGLGEISPDEFRGFIGKDIRINKVEIGRDSQLDKLLEFYMGKNTPIRQNFIIDNLKIEKNEF